MSEYQYEEKEGTDGKKVKVLGATYEEGRAEGSQNWREKLDTPEERLGYLKTALRYWYSSDWFGSEKRKQDA
jgi:hypothetical protein